MKRVYNAIRVVMMVAAVTLMSSCNEEVIYNYLKISDSSFSLDAAGQQEFTIEITASSDWSSTIQDSWIQEVSKDANGLTVKAEPYSGATPRYGSILIETADDSRKISVLQNNNSVSAVVNDLFYTSNSGVVSPSGYYLAGNITVSDTETMPVTIDLRTGEVRKFTCTLPTEIDVPERETTYEVSWLVSAVDDNGNVFMNNSVLIFGLRLDAASGDYSLIEVPDDCIGGCVSAVSADGSIWVGSCCPLTGGWFPMKWVNGVPERLPITAQNGTGVQNIWYGATARGCSDDGSIIYGNIMDYDEAIYWDKDNEFHFVAPELLEYDTEDYYGTTYYNLFASARIYADAQRISPDGSKLSFIYTNENTGASYPGYIDTASGVPTMLSNLSGYDITTISNDGELFLCPSALALEPTTVYTTSGEKIGGMDWIFSNYGISIGDSRAITQVAANGNIFGMKSSGDYYVAWWLDLN